MLLELFTMNMNDKIIIKSLKQSISWLHRKVNLSTKRNTHYETLGVSKNATHNEIKTAYYNLTLKYHPDKNKTETAKLKFHEVSHAYDVLGKYESRKQYDRTISIKHGRIYSTKEKKVHPADKTIHYPKGKIYNFDTWLKEHYTQTFESQMELKKRDKEKKQAQDDSDIGATIMVGGFVLLAMAAMFHNWKIQRNKSVTDSSKDR